MRNSAEQRRLGDAKYRLGDDGISCQGGGWAAETATGGLGGAEQCLGGAEQHGTGASGRHGISSRRRRNIVWEKKTEQPLNIFGATRAAR